MTAKIIAKALGARKEGSASMAKCPTHDDRELEALRPAVTGGGIRIA
jgi:hypothetical protein